MNDKTSPEALYYPFHLCHERTLTHLLTRCARVHFRDYMALQLTPFSGTTAYQDRMGNSHPELVAEGRLVQGHSVSGPLSAQVAQAIDRDLSDDRWRELFHHAFTEDRRFQRGLFDLTHAFSIGGTVRPGAAVLLELVRDRYRVQPYSVDLVRSLSRRAHHLPDAYDYEYGLALIKTSASLVHTAQLAAQLGCLAVTDSPSHATLFAHSRTREGWTVDHELIEQPF
ncbi:MAG: hypothetical protein U0172_01845 [Nitrospiraceae bacterium]